MNLSSFLAIYLKETFQKRKVWKKKFEKIDTCLVNHVKNRIYFVPINVTGQLKLLSFTKNVKAQNVIPNWCINQSYVWKYLQKARWMNENFLEIEKMKVRPIKDNKQGHCSLMCLFGRYKFAVRYIVWWNFKSFRPSSYD